MKAYPEYKSTNLKWIENIPIHWEYVRAQYLFDIVSGSTPNSTDDTLWNGDINWITPADFNTRDHYITKGKRSISQKGYKSCSTTLVPSGSIIFSKRAPIGKVVIANDELCTNQGCFGCIPVKELSNNYFYYLMCILEPQYNLLGSGSTFLEISAKEFCSFRLLLPPMKEQTTIASYLDHVTGQIDALMSEKQTQIDDLRKYRMSLITEAVTRGLNNDVYFKKSEIDWVEEIPANWSCVSTQYLFNVVSGSTPDSTNEKLWDGGIKWITPADFKTEYHYICEGKRTISQEGYESCSTTLLPIGSIIFSKRAPIGKVVIASDELCTNQGCFGCETIGELSNNYYYYLMSILGPQYNKLGSGSTFMEISAKEFNNFKLLCPPIREQKEIAEYLDEKTNNIDELIAELETQLKDLAEYKKAVITEAVTGKVDVRDWKLED